MTLRRCFAALLLAILSLLGGACGIGNAQARLRTAVDAKKPSLDTCYGRALERDKNASGEMQLWIHVDESTGRVKRVEIARTAIEQAELEECVRTALQGVELDPKPKANLKVEYTLRFSPAT